MKVLITGVAGFIGSHLADTLLAMGHTIYGIDDFDPFYPKEIKLKNIAGAAAHPNFHFFEFDITEKNNWDILGKEKFDLIYHLAAKAGVRPSIEQPLSYLYTNVEGTLNLLEYMRGTGDTKLVFASSSSIYGNCKTIPFSESALTDEPISPYAFSKKSCELLNYNYHHLYNIDIINLRFFTVYGPRQRPDLAIHKFMNRISAGQPIEIYGDGTTARDYTYIEDIVSGVIKAGDYLAGHKNVFEIVNLGNNSPVMLMDMVDTFKKVLGTDFATVRKPMQDGDVDITYADISKAHRLFGYDPQTSFEDGLTRFVAWHQAEHAGTAAI